MAPLGVLPQGPGIDRCIECKEPWVVNENPDIKGICIHCGAVTHPTRSQT